MLARAFGMIGSGQEQGIDIERGRWGMVLSLDRQVIERRKVCWLAWLSPSGVPTLEEKYEDISNRAIKTEGLSTLGSGSVWNSVPITIGVFAYAPSGNRRNQRLFQEGGSPRQRGCPPLHVLQFRSLRMTPAMTAGVTGKLWEIADIVALIEAKEAEKPVVCGPYKTRA